MKCDCLEKIDKCLKEKNLRLTGFAFEPHFNVVPTFKTERIDPDKVPKGMRKSPPTMLASYCPFCGKPVRDTPPSKNEAEVKA